MSGSPKYSQAELERRRQAELEAERRRQAELEAQRRREAEARARQQRLEQRRSQVQHQAQQVLAEIQQAQALIYADAAQSLQRTCQQHLNAVAQATDENRLQRLAEQVTQVSADLQQEISRKRRDDEEKQRRAELERQQFELSELERQVQQIPPADATKFDAAGQAQVQQALPTVRQAIAQGNPAAVRSPLQQAIAAVNQHSQQVSQRRADWQRRKAEAEQQQGELVALIAGLEADPVVMRWQADEVATLQQQAQAAQQAIVTEQFDQVAPLLKAAQEQAQEIVAIANAAQLKADQRDYIANSIAQTLEEMGFGLRYRQPEHDHPASAILIGAATNSGKGICVSVPVEGEVLYDVEGYAKQTAAAVGGGTAAVCDEAEQVITEMHQVLADQFGVQMSELTWEGKDPNRQLRKADALPSSQPARSRTR